MAAANLGEYLVLEGLAYSFEDEIDGPTFSPLFGASARSTARYPERLDPSWVDWMFGGDLDGPNLSHQWGYSLAYAVVRNCLTVTSDTAFRAVGVEAPTVPDSWFDRPSVAIQDSPSAVTPVSQAPPRKLG